MTVCMYKYISLLCNCFLIEMLSKPTKTGQLHWINIKNRMIPQEHEENNMENDIVKNDVFMERRLFNTIVYGLPHLTLI